MNLSLFAAFALLVSPFALVFGSVQGFAGFLLGVTGATLNLVAWWMLIGSASRSVAEARNPKGATLVVLLSFFLKAPLLAALAFGAHHIGGAAARWCIGGIVLVYFGLVGWSLGKS